LSCYLGWKPDHPVETIEKEPLGRGPEEG
jgi:hypothetical protein